LRRSARGDRRRRARIARPEQIERTRVAWVDTDAGGRIHFTAVFRWVEAAETALMRRLGLLEDWPDYPRRHVEADYLKVLVFEDEIEVLLRVEQVGHTSITYAWEIAKGGETYVHGSHTVVHVDQQGRPARLPEAVRVALS
jgi:YbgC/YbaW family acyl-CoA thioester hydrolase